MCLCRYQMAPTNNTNVMTAKTTAGLGKIEKAALCFAGGQANEIRNPRTYFTQWNLLDNIGF